MQGVSLILYPNKQIQILMIFSCWDSMAPNLHDVIHHVHTKIVEKYRFTTQLRKIDSDINSQADFSLLMLNTVFEQFPIKTVIRINKANFSIFHNKNNDCKCFRTMPFACLSNMNKAPFIVGKLNLLARIFLHLNNFINWS